MKVIEGGFGQPKDESGKAPSPEEILKTALEKYSKADAIFVVVEGDEFGTVSMSNIPLPGQLMWLDMLKLSFLTEQVYGE